MATQREDSPAHVLFVCLGNICRSPTAEGVFRKLIERKNLSDSIQIDSAGTSAYHLGEPPDPRAQEAALKRGIDLSALQARQTTAEDFKQFDYILAMDNDNHTKLLHQCPPGEEHRVRLFLEFAPDAGRAGVPDPYTSNADGFELVLNLIEIAAAGLLKDILDNR
jgi:protein-tyrosine phosphatase